MADDSGPQVATADEFPEVLDLLDRVFGYGSGGMRAHIPNWFDDSHPERYAVVKRDDQVVSTVGCLPQTFVVGGGEVDWWGLGNVATDPAYRGNGYMTDLLEFWLDRLAERGVPLVELGGDTKRYNRFGWENAGREYTYAVDERTFPGGDVDTGDVRRYRGTVADVDLLLDVHRDEPYRVKRTRESCRGLFDQHGLDTLLYTGAGGDAYLSYNQESPSGRYSVAGSTRAVPEFGGSEAGVRALLAHLWETVAVDRLEVRAHPTHHLNGYLRELSTTWSLRPHRMVNVLDLADALRGFSAQMSRRWAAAPRANAGAVTLDVEDADTPPVTLTYEQSRVTVSETPSRTPTVSLDKLEMTQFLFGFPGVYPDLRSADPFLEATLPLDFYIWRIEGP